MICIPSNTRVFLAPGNTDMRKAINGLSVLVEGTLELDPFSGHLFVFCISVLASTPSKPKAATGHGRMNP
ncbi:IS66 family insertion sequence element accessory protein TnpB [Desulforhabdus amnigena]|uniref:Uncharacterized protein n=1 Tax=Desulforhabdus amnigena TaxID=40218 RepID=A0A9W6CZN4_9BACT|nr:IS66 family insertion sequence element accessory protein TnpB [Desulforhabdus amnigena]NLJ27810.1 transposase [Deltaproteobacteria bacterium]GLI33262.1 hypothetical protein DAMNIGENAA_06950 [Desulforhabdus amnigena]